MSGVPTVWPDDEVCAQSSLISIGSTKDGLGEGPHSSGAIVSKVM